MQCSRNNFHNAWKSSSANKRFSVKSVKNSMTFRGLKLESLFADFDNTIHIQGVLCFGYLLFIGQSPISNKLAKQVLPRSSPNIRSRTRSAETCG